jgi:hypothetical protein
MTFFKKLKQWLTGNPCQPSRFPEEEEKVPEYLKLPNSPSTVNEAIEESPRNYVSLNRGILEIVKFNLPSSFGKESPEFWYNLFSVAWLEGRWPDGTYSLNYPLFDKYVERTGAAESRLSNHLKMIDPSNWHVPAKFIEPIENMKDAYVLLNL